MFDPPQTRGEGEMESANPSSIAWDELQKSHLRSRIFNFSGVVLMRKRLNETKVALPIVWIARDKVTEEMATTTK